MDWWTVALAALLGLGLAASTGLNTWLPLLLLSAAARLHLGGVQLNGSFAWLESNVALAVLLIATLIEVIADKVPAVDHMLHSIATFVRPLAAAMAVAAAFTKLDPVPAAVIGLMIGAPAAIGMHSIKSATRVGSSITTLGCANPLLSLVEDAISLSLSTISILMPLVVPVAIAVIVLAGVYFVRRKRARESRI